MREAVASVLPPERLRHIAFSHVEADECGSLNEWLAVAPQAQPLCSAIARLVSIDDLADRPARGLEDGEAVQLGKHRLRWLATPHLPHAWECGMLIDDTTGTLLCGDLFTQPGADLPAMTGADILGPSEAFRRSMDYYSHTKHGDAMLERLAALAPRTLACMHGSAWQGDGAALIRALAQSLRD